MRWAVLGLAVLGCSTTTLRTPRELYGSPGVAVSNSPMFDRPREPRLEHGRLSVTYSFLIENFASAVQSVALGQASLSVAQRHPPVSCAVSGHALAELLVEPGGRYRIDCELSLDLREVPLKSLGDRKAQLAIPATLDGREHDLTFDYLFRREDAS